MYNVHLPLAQPQSIKATSHLIFWVCERKQQNEWKIMHRDQSLKASRARITQLGELFERMRTTRKSRKDAPRIEGKNKNSIYA
jgi:hypothetical protein